MRSKAVLALAMALLACGCASKSKCPIPVNYDAKTLKEIEKAREALPKDSVLHQVLEDYENERDDLRFCR
jgi:type IV pilus biogenesis protein CpaD/CtpE